MMVLWGCVLLYRVMLVVWQLGWVDLVFQVPPVCPFALPIQPKPQQPKQTQAGSVLTQLNLLPDHQHHPVEANKFDSNKIVRQNVNDVWELVPYIYCN